MKLSKLAFAAVLGVGLTAGPSSESQARLSDYVDLMPKDDLARAIQSAERRSGIKLEDVTDWTRTNSAEYQRFWQAFRYNYEDCVVDGRCSQEWNYFTNNGGDGSAGGGDGGAGAGDGGGAGSGDGGGAGDGGPE